MRQIYHHRISIVDVARIRRRISRVSLVLGTIYFTQQQIEEDIRHSSERHAIIIA
ncbi:MAG: hypothetical protein WBF13_13090 [Candidatus Zixiibacteriota bacterium]